MTDTIPNADRDAFYKLFEEAPGDLTAYGVFADLMDELGYPSIAYGYRWMSARGVFPHKRTHYTDGATTRRAPAKHRWAWYGNIAMLSASTVVPGVLSASPLKLHVLPKSLLNARQCVWPSHAAAVMYLAERLQRLKDTYTTEPPSKGL